MLSPYIGGSTKYSQWVCFLFLSYSDYGRSEVFLLTGGVVTFTFTALLENPVAVADIIEKIYSHRLWSCYILPSVFSMFIRLACPGTDPVVTYKEYVTLNTFVFAFNLTRP